MAHIIGETKAKVAIVVPSWRDRDLASPLAANRSTLDLQCVVVIGDGPAGTISLADLDPLPLPSGLGPNPADVACVIYTSGSTATPKGVRHSHETLLSGLLLAPTSSKSCTLGTFPSGHVAALLALLRPLSCGGTTVMMDRWSARVAVELVEEYGVTASAGTPFFLSTLLDEAQRSGRDISSLSRFLVGAATVPAALVERAEAAGIVSWRTYGSTEHPAISTGQPDDPPEKRRCTDGRAAPGNEVRLVDESGQLVSPGQEGEVVARGPKQFLGYQDPDLDRDAFLDGTWFRTGDLAVMDDDDYLVITDRVKDIIIRGGENISASEVEGVLVRHPGVREVAIFAAPDDIWGESVCAAIVACDGGCAPSLADLAAHAEASGLAPHKIPTRVLVSEDLPRTAAGKVLKRELRTWL
jgi:acyl-CoA synthetase (AMP-forming)/AMP-acid ligase II